ncbi:50S ribosomal protein L18 [Candidatus Woesearchaeota archaeon]|nr:50S ribosomal protein L18 [Candidatus Woesearchaeota archaeon]
MARKKMKRVLFRRKRENKTNYYKRLDLLKSSSPRLVVRVFSNSITIQLVAFEHKGDKVLASACSADLVKLGWTHKPNNTPGCYLTGLLLAKRASKDVTAIADFGFQTTSSRLYAALKGVVDGGLTIPVGEGIFPSEDRIKGSHIAGYVAKSASIEKDFEDMKKKIDGQ